MLVHQPATTGFDITEKVQVLTTYCLLEKNMLFTVRTINKITEK